MEKKSKEIASVYWHIGNSGVSFGIVDEGHGPCFTVQSSSFGNMETVQKYYTDKKSLQALRDMIDKGLTQKQYSEEYCEKARILDEELIGNLVEAKRAKFEGQLVSYTNDGTVVYQFPNGDKWKYYGVDMAQFNRVKNNKRTKDYQRNGDVFDVVKRTKIDEEKI